MINSYIFATACATGLELELAPFVQHCHGAKWLGLETEPSQCEIPRYNEVHTIYERTLLKLYLECDCETENTNIFYLVVTMFGEA